MRVLAEPPRALRLRCTLRLPTLLTAAQPRPAHLPSEGGLVGLDLLSILLPRLGMHRTSVRRVDGFAPESAADISEALEEAAAHAAVLLEAAGRHSATARRSPTACALLRTAAQCAEQVRRLSDGARPESRARAA